ncbi:MAG: hypothetical protein LUH45_03480, partial [Clostridiales bacterium]|nr:hypothetical protein [Clostridiales bacterium]
SFQGGPISDPVGAMFCIWSDYPGALTDTQVASQTASVIAAFGATLPSTVVTSTATDEDANVTVTVTGTKLSSVTASPVEDNDDSFSYQTQSEGATAFAAYIVTITDTNDDIYTGSAIVTMPLPESITTVTGVYVSNGDGTYDACTDISVSNGYVTFTAPHFSTVVIEGTADADEVEVTNKETITVSVGGTATATISGYNFAGTYSTEDTGIASVTVTGTTTEASSTTTYSGTKVTSATSGSTYYVGDGTNYLVLSGSTLSTTTDISQATAFTWMESGNGNKATHYLSNGSYYLRYNNNAWSVTTSENQRTSFNSYSGSLTSGNNTNTGYSLYTMTEKTETVEAQNYTTVTVTGVAVGTTYVTVGNTRYTINVTAEDLSSVTGLTVEFWITNRQVTANGSTSMTVSASGAYGESGVLISSLVPSTGTYGGNNMIYWKTTRLTSSYKQTNGSGVDRTNSGNDFTYIRYYGGSWAFSSDGTTWTTISSSDQIVAYYLQETSVTTEVTTYVADWGESYPYSITQYVLVDYAVKYESGDRTPDAFPINSTTLVFHCTHGDEACGQSGSYYYRNIGTILAENTEDYEVYMITVTPTSDSASTTLADNADNNGTNNSNFYAGTEMVAWVIDMETLATTAFNDESLYYTGITGDFELQVGGDPTVQGLQIYDKHGMLVTYYVRAKQTEDSLTVNYVDQTTDTQFYSYNIAVNSGTTFSTDPSIALDENGNVVNGTVTNSLNKTQTVSSDLSTLAAVSALYKNSDYTCVSLELSADGKTVTLYYTFDTTAYFVVDFGLPVEITGNDILSGSTITAVVGTGVTLSDGTITWQTTEVMTGIQSFYATVSVTENNNTASHTYTVYMIPATTVYYEEGFANYGTGWSVTPGTIGWETYTNKGTSPQETEIANKENNSYNNYNYDRNANVDSGENGTAASTTTPGDSLTFTFTGTGVDIFANCDENSGVVGIKVTDAEDKTEKMLTVDMADIGSYASGDTAYNTPIASISGLTYGSHTVTIYLAKAGDSGFKFDGFRVYGTIDESNDNATKAVYTADDEDSPNYYELRNYVLGTLVTDINSSTYADDIANGVAQVYATNEVDKSDSAIVVYSTGSGIVETADENILDNGPKNELYLDSGASVVFKINTTREVQIGLRSVTGASVTYTINGTSYTTSSSVDMFYDLQAKGANSETTYTITVTSGGI